MAAEDKLIRLSKLLSERGICSRREADVWIENGWVVVDDVVISQLGTKVHPEAHIELKKEAKSAKNEQVTIMLYKPIGYVSTQPEKNYRAAIELLTRSNQVKHPNDPPYHPSIFKKIGVVGRLDIDSKGLLLFTQDGTVAKAIIGPTSHVEKEYCVRVDGEITPAILKKLTHGLSLDGKPLKPAKVTLIKPELLSITLTEGKKRQVRRMCEKVGLNVLWLKRIRIGPLTLGRLPEGKWRFVHERELTPFFHSN